MVLCVFILIKNLPSLFNADLESNLNNKVIYGSNNTSTSSTNISKSGEHTSLTTPKKYYFSSISGDDSRTPAQASNAATPWKTISKLNSYFTNLNAGDSVLFKRGEIFSGTIRIKKSGALNNNIKFSAYGTGPKPMINGLTKISGWTLVGNGIYESSVNPGLLTNVKMLAINNIPFAMGRYPNANSANKGYFNFESHNANLSITDYQLHPSPNWSGAEIVIRKKRFVRERGLILSHIGNTLTYLAGSAVPLDGFGYFIQNDIRTLDQFGEWYYNPLTKKISMYFGGYKPSDFTVQANYLDTLVSLRVFSYITFDNICFNGGGAFGFDVYNSNYSEIKNCDIYLCGEGIKAAISNNLNLSSNKILNCSSMGIDLVNAVHNANVRNNIIRKTGLFPGMGFNTGNSFSGLISENSNGSLFEYNQIDSSGFGGIEFSGNNLTIKNNLVNYYALTLDDIGGIYSSGGSDTNIISTNRKITGNIILNGIGIPEGTTVNYGLTGGIYLDNNCTNMQITGNTCFNNYWGLIVHNSKKNLIRANTLYDNTINFYMLQNPPHQKVRNDTVKSNIIVAKDAIRKTGSYQTTANDISYFGMIDSNYYARPIDDNYTIQTVIYYGLPNQIVSQRNFSQWQTYSGFDAHGSKSPETITDTSQISFKYNATQSPLKIALAPGSWIDVKKTSYSGSVTLQPYTSIVLIPASGSGLITLR